MFVAAAIVSGLLAALMTYAAIRKLSHEDQVVRRYARVGVPEDALNHLAIILLAGAIGLVVGLVWAPVGIAAAIGTTCYFVAAVAAHIRANDVKSLPTPATMAILAAAALATRLAAF